MVLISLNCALLFYSFNIAEKPHFVSRLPQSLEGEFGRSAVLPCAAEGSPDPEVEWRKDGVPLAETPNLR